MGDFKKAIVKDKFKVGDRVCIITENILHKDIKQLPSLHDYHNGYVSSAKENENKGYDLFIKELESEELTYSGTLDELEGETPGCYKIPKNIWFFGFDSMHFGDTKRTSSFEYVKKRTKQLAKEMIKKNI